MAAKSRKLTEALNKALELETEGKAFYLECAEKTRDVNGKQMFKYLAGEEEDHLEKVEKIYREEFNKEFTEFREKYRKNLPPSGVFQRKAPGASVDKKAGALDALNIGLLAEENSILLYSRLESMAQSDRLKKVFRKLAAEEQKHLLILRQAIETMTETGAYYDFKIVTS